MCTGRMDPTFIVKALALGANGVLIGRPWLWAVAARGEKGLTDYLRVLRQDIAVCMALMGVNRIADITPDLLERARLTEDDRKILARLERESALGTGSERNES